MKKHLFLASSISILSLSLLNAAPSVYEGFDYSGAADVAGENGGTGWDGAWSINGGGPSVVAQYSGTSLSNGAFTGAGFTSVGGALGNDHDTFVAQRSFASGLSMDVDADYYFSYLMSVPTTDSMTVLFDGTSAGGAFFSRFTGGAIAATAGGGTFSTAGSEAYATNTTYFVVGKIAASASGNDVLSLNVFDTSETIGAEAFLVSSAGAAVTGSITGIGVQQDDPINNNGTPLLFDEFRLGSSWSDVTAIPEPSAYGLLAGCLAMSALMLRRRK